MRLVQMVTTIDDTEVTYDVVDGDLATADMGGAHTLWTRTVAFGQTDATVVGGAAFVQAAREQEAFAMRLRQMPDDEVVQIIRLRREHNLREQAERAHMPQTGVKSKTPRKR